MPPFLTKRQIIDFYLAMISAFFAPCCRAACFQTFLNSNGFQPVAKKWFSTFICPPKADCSREAKLSITDQLLAISNQHSTSKIPHSTSKIISNSKTKLEIVVFENLKNLRAKNQRLLLIKVQILIVNLKNHQSLIYFPII